MNDDNAHHNVLLVGEMCPHTLGPAFADALRGLGHRVETFDPSTEFHQYFGIGRHALRRLLCELLGVERFNRHVRRVLQPEKFDIILIFKGWILTAETVADLKRRNPFAVLCNWNGDDPFLIGNRGMSNRRILDAIPLYDLYLTWTRRLVAPLLAGGAKRADVLPVAWDPATHQPVTLTSDERATYGSDVAFVGNWDSWREQWLAPLAACKDFELKIWGGDYWRTRCRSRACRRRYTGRPVVGSEMAKVLCGTRVNVNILREQGRNSHNMRSFEIPGCGAFMLTDRTAEHADFFREGEDIGCFSTPTELLEKARYYLAHRAEAERCARNAHEQVRHHTYHERMLRLLELCQDCRTERSAR